MNTRLYRAYSRGLALLIALALGAYASAELSHSITELSGKLAILLCLLPPAIIAARRGGAAAEAGPVRAALTFVLAAIALLPLPGGLLVAVTAGIAARGAGVAGPYRRGLASLVSMAVAVALAEHLAGAFHWPGDPASAAMLFPLAVVFLIIQGFAVVLRLALDDAPDATLLTGTPATWQAHLLEGLNVPLAWLLAALLARGSWLAALGLSALILLAREALERLARARRELKAAHTSLSSRITELSRLHAISREILSSSSADRVFVALDAGCRKLLDADACSIALVHPESSRLRQVFSRIGDRSTVGERLVEYGIAVRALHGKRAQRIGEVTELPAEGSLRRNLQDPETRSVLAVPLLVEDRVIGVLTVESRRAEAHDEQQVSVLSTLTRQAAVAVENARHQRMASVDSLTGFFVKDYFFRRLDEEHKRVRRYGGHFALLMLDLDGFKAINDDNGHLAGDRFLGEITVTIRQRLRAADLPCRYGGDEFCLLLPETDLAGAQAIAERIREAVARRIVTFDGLALRTTVSIGVAAFPDHDAGDLRGLMRNADEALYRAKKAGRDRVVPFAA